MTLLTLAICTLIAYLVGYTRGRQSVANDVRAAVGFLRNFTKGK